ncbi:MAG: SDR family oxidoreductase [Isosphaeraceae bacterium]
MALDGQIALVTGAGSGIGRATARALAESGASVILVGRERGKLEAVAAEIGSKDLRVEPCDVADREAVADLAKRLDQPSKPLDILVSNAGTNVSKRGLDVLSPADWDTMIATNLTGAFNLIHEFLPGMRARGRGLVVQIASISGLRASLLGGAGYSASKFGQAALGMCLGREDGPKGIRSTVIYPGEVETPILDRRPVAVPRERRQVILQPEDVAAAVKFVAELPDRARVPELVITPTVDDFF